MTQIEINPGQLTNAARGLEQFVVPDLTDAARRMADSYRLDPPGLGALLSFAEAYYNSVADYQLRNLETAVQVVESVAAGLRRTVANYHAAEQANVDMFLAPAAAAPDGYLGGLGDAGFPRLFTDPLGGMDGLGDGAAEVLTVGTLTMFVGLGVATAAMAPDYLPAPLTASAMVANGFSVIEAARELGAVAAALEGSVIKKFDGYATGATAGWVDGSVVEYRDVVAEVSRELGQVQKALSALSASLLAVAGLLTAFVAFIAFTAEFFVVILDLTLSSIGPQALVLQPIIQALGAAASASWLTASGTVITVATAAVTLLSGVVKEFAAVQTFDEQGDGTPDLRQLRISWHSA
ncbi:hypothetical protein [Micromonospora sp. ATA51]|uniref:hypothetical protein n=1 Tax=Micromonospora sp. ATA51 TaxID=2806098 RepID=UPI001A610AA8|nr:hypothetical protein [Micromonospora sp. ATA51]MBM0226944.1 hypothetical protein [Micromonospora sp. ATA51]